MSSPSVSISSHDPSSFGNNRSAKVTHSHLNLKGHAQTDRHSTPYYDDERRSRGTNVSFESSTLSGYVDHNVELIADTTQLILDTALIKISGVTLADGSALKYTLGETHPIFGTPLVIDLPAGAKTGSKYVVRVSYTTDPSAGALQWLPPAQTKGGKLPYLFSQCQAIHCRSLVPIQDSPSQKFTYSAELTVDAPLVALMSAEQIAVKTIGSQIQYSFNQKVPIPSYLVALAVGELEKRQLGPRSHVWSEKAMVDAGAFEFSETEKFIAAGEAIAGPYVWGHYDILLLPPSFPYGGMENPCLTFVTPTLLAGDRSLSNVVAHEIAHSWFGNFVTSETWEHFWMNEGFTVFLERKICKAMHANEEKARAVHGLHSQIGLNDLQKSVDRFGADHPHTCLCPRLQGIDPDDAFSSVPYEKGFNFLIYLENLVGGESVMNPFLKAHCAHYAHRTVNSADWKVFFLNYMTNTAKISKEKLDTIDWDSWFNKPGMPVVKNEFDQSLIVGSETLATKLIVDGQQPKQGDLNGWDSAQVVIFLEKLLEYQKSALAGSAAEKDEFAKKIIQIDSIYGFTSSKNSEIRFRWLTLCIRQPLVDRFPAIEQFLGEQGRMKFTRPLYRDLFTLGGPEGKEFALATFKKYKNMYHSICAKMVARDLQLE